MKRFSKGLFAVSLFIFSSVSWAVVVQANVDVSSQAAVVVDFDTGEVLFERDAYSRRAPASMTKVQTAFVVYEEIAAGNLSMDTMVRISQNAAQTPFERMIRAGRYHSVDTMLHLIMLPSSNGGSVALAEHVSGTEGAFVSLMNETARGIGLDADFRNSHGLDPNYITAHSMAMLVREFIQRHPDILRITSARSFTFDGVARGNTNRLIQGDAQHYAGADGFKTGFTSRAGSCLVSTAYRDGRRVIAVAMNAPNRDSRDRDSRAMLDFGFAELARREAARVNVVLDGTPLEFDVQPQLVNGQAMLPLRPIFEALGARVEWDEVEQTNIAFTDNGDRITLFVDNNRMYVNGRRIELGTPPQLVNARTMVPTSLIAEVMDLRVTWIGETQTVVLNRN